MFSDFNVQFVHLSLSELLVCHFNNASCCSVRYLVLTNLYSASAKLVDSALATGKIYEGEGFKYIKESFETGTLHLIGLLSDGGVHSRLDQLLV